MAFDIVGAGLDFIEQYGLVAMFILLVLDGALLLPVFPGELVLITAVATYAHDPYSLALLIALSSAAGLMGSIILYGITRGGGRRLVEKYPGFFMMPRRRRERLERAFQNPFGQSLVLFLRLFPLTRVLVSIPAGLARMPFVRFLVLSTIGMVAYHTGFLWFTYEAQREGSEISEQANLLRDAYASPAWDVVQANTIITGLVIIVLGVFLSIRASVRMYRDPEESTGSLIGSLATMALFWGGLALAAATYMDPEFVYALIAVGGLDIHQIAEAVGYSPVQVLWGVAAIAVVLAWLLGRVRSGAKMRRNQRLALQRHIRAQQEKQTAQAGPRIRPVGDLQVDWEDEEAPWIVRRTEWERPRDPRSDEERRPPGDGYDPDSR